jgi:Tfp pilus assembly protein PilV
MRTFFEKTGVGRGFARGWATASRSQRASDERGFLLIEVMISALLVALIAVGTFSAFDVSGRVQSDERDRAQAVTLAQQDEERLRGLTSAELSSLNEENTVTLQKVKYKVISSATFVSDTSGAESCSGSGNSADYFKTTSEVTWATVGKRPPIVQTGLVAPPAGGELEVLVSDGRGGFTSGMNVTGTGPAGFSGITSANGCLIFGPLEEGTYNVNASQTGYVGPEGETEVPTASRPESVTGQTTATDSLVFNKAGKIEAKPETAPSSLGGAETLNIVAGQTGLSTGFRNLLTSVSGYTTTTPIASPQTFFPFPSGYTIYAGTCLANAPSNFGGTLLSTPTLEPGGTVSEKVIEPGMIVLLYEGTSATKKSLISKPEIWIKDTDTGSGCNTTSYKVNTVTTPNVTTGDLEKPGLPYGKYTICANFLKGSSKFHATTTTPIENKNITAGTKVELYEGGSSPEVTSGTCP